MRTFLLVIYFLTLAFSGIAQIPLTKDSSLVTPRSFSGATIKSYKTDKDFQYDSVSEPPKSLWERFWEWVYRVTKMFLIKIGKLFRINLSGKTIETLLILLMLAILTFFLLKIIGMDRVGLFGKINTEGIGYSLMDENLQTINFPQAIEDAVSKKNFRMAVRLLYLQTLKNLTNQNLINWQMNKTDEVYIHELDGNLLQRPFIDLTRQFESNWYGGIPIDEIEFGIVSGRFRNFNDQFIR